MSDTKFPPQVHSLEQWIKVSFPDSAWQREVLLRMLERIEAVEKLSYKLRYPNE